MRSNWLDFLTDYGDALGGVFLGYGIGKESLLSGIIGVVLLISSIYLRHYHGAGTNSE